MSTEQMETELDFVRSKLKDKDHNSPQQLLAFRRRRDTLLELIDKSNPKPKAHARRR